MTRSHSHRPVVGLALGSGAARGLAHFGVLRAIRELGIQIDVVAGTSIGAFIGAAFASGTSDALEREFREFDWRTIGSYFDPGVPRSGLIKGRRVTEFIRSHLTLRTIEELPIPFRAVAANITTGEEVIFSEGDLLRAIRASISIPGIFTPVRHESHILVDGGLVNPVPVSVVRSMGADVVIAVDLSHDLVAGRSKRRFGKRSISPATLESIKEEREYVRAAERIRAGLRTSTNPAIRRLRSWLEREQLPSIIEVLLSSLHIMEVRITESRLRLDKPDVLIRPPLSSIHLLEFNRADKAIEIGYAAAMEPLRALTKAPARR